MKTSKNKLTNILKIGILFFGISMLLWSCEKDIEINEFHNISDNEKLDYTLEKIGYSKLITDQEIEKSLPVIKGRFSNNKKGKKQSKKTTQISEHFSIIKDSVHKITTQDVITWSFKIETPVLKNSDFENFLVKKHNEEFSYFLVSYEKDLETKYKKAILYPISKETLNLDNLNLARKGDYLMPDDGDGGGGGCSGKLVFGRCSVGGEANGHGPALQRDGVTRCSGSPFLYIDFTHCRNAGMIDLNDIPNYNTPDNNNTQNGDSGLSNNGGSSSSGGTTITNPVTLECDNCSNSLSLISYLNLTDQSQIDWVNNANNSQTVTKLSNFGNTNQWSESVITISGQVISGLSNTNNLSLSFEENIAVKNKATEIFDIIARNNFSNIDQYSIADQKTIAQNSLFISFLPNLKDLGIELPQTAEEWAEFGEILVEVMYEIIPDLIPGVAELNSLKNSISAFSNGSYIDGTTELAFALIGVFPAGKLMKALAKFAKLAKKTAKIFKVYLKLFKLNKYLARGFKKVISEPNTMNKIFASHHNLDILINKTGGKKEALLAAFNRVQELDLTGALPANVGKTFSVLVNGESLKVNLYKFSNGIIQISDMWKP